jgi:uncharacterized membrane protein
MAVVPPNPAPDTLACPHCAFVMPVGMAFCPGCGRALRPIPSSERGAAAIAYLTLVPAAVLLLLPAFRSSRFVRFHAWQSVLLWGVFFGATLLSLFLSNMAAAVLFLFLGILASLAMFFLWLVLTLKAWRGERLELPIFGGLARRLG